MLGGGQVVQGGGWAVLDVGGSLRGREGSFVYYAALGEGKEEVGRNLYSRMREAEATEGVERVGVVSGGGEAVVDRVTRASEGKWWTGD